MFESSDKQPNNVEIGQNNKDQQSTGESNYVVHQEAGPRRHLKDGIKPIFACVGTEGDFQNEFSEEAHYFDINYLGDKVDNVDYFKDPESLKRRGMKNAGEYTYVISEVNDRDKFSAEFRNCTMLVVTGIDKKSGENISLMSHQDPTEFLSFNKDNFVQHLLQRLQELKEKSVEGTIDAVIAGGNLRPDYLPQDALTRDYTGSIALLTEHVKELFGFEPLVIVGPKTVKGGDSVFYDSHNRRLFIVRPEAMRGKSSNFSYNPNNLDQELDNWKGK
ncbi:MAG: hypothetical protein KBD16_01580 [Candidatus Pacebacteria bacterium]|nr:hypothetical protein [Candidatus Paceibacterota bacterium]